MPEQYVNAVSTTLSAAVTTTSQTTVSVTSATGFPTSGNFRILVAAEVMLVTAVAGTNFTVTRGVEGSVPATYLSGATVDHILTSGALDAIRADICNTGTYASLPASGSKPGDLYIPTDSFYDFLRWNGSSWDHFRGGRLMTPPVNVSYSWDNQSATTVSTTNGGVVLFQTPGTSGLHVRYKTAPATPYTIYTAFLPHYSASANSQVGLCFRSSGGAIANCGVTYNGSWNVVVSKWTTTSVFSASYASVSIYPSLVHGPVVWMALKDDGTNRSFLYSGNGVNWSTINSQVRTDFLTPTQVGFYCGDNNSTLDTGTTMLHWLET